MKNARHNASSSCLHTIASRLPGTEHLGHVAKRYYAGGALSTQMLKDAYAGLTQEAQGLQTRYLPAIQEQARTLDAGKARDGARRLKRLCSPASCCGRPN